MTLNLHCRIYKSGVSDQRRQLFHLVGRKKPGALISCNPFCKCQSFQSAGSAQDTRSILKMVIGLPCWHGHQKNYLAGQILSLWHRLAVPSPQHHCKWNTLALSQTLFEEVLESTWEIISVRHFKVNLALFSVCFKCSTISCRNVRRWLRCNTKGSIVRHS